GRLVCQKSGGAVRARPCSRADTLSPYSPQPPLVSTYENPARSRGGAGFRGPRRAAWEEKSLRAPLGKRLRAVWVPTPAARFSRRPPRASQRSRGLARGVFLVREDEGPHPWASHRRGVGLVNTTDNSAVGEHVEIVIAPLHGTAVRWRHAEASAVGSTKARLSARGGKPGQ